MFGSNLAVGQIFVFVFVSFFPFFQLLITLSTHHFSLPKQDSRDSKRPLLFPGLARAS